MFQDLFAALPQERLSHVPRVVSETSLARDIDDLAQEILPGRTVAVVSDPITRQALGERVERALRSSRAMPVTFENVPRADDKSVDYVRARSQRCDALVAVGSGTINDICKYAAFLDNKPYIVFPTAASMNGYLSANASISISGYKKTVAARMPLAVLCDLSVIAAAPARLSKSGLGDTLARSTAQADWLLSHLLLGTGYDDTPFTLLEPYEAPLFDQARGVALGDRESVRALMHVLLLSGIGMTVAGGSYPASQAEHMIAHTYNMLVADQPSPSTFHGEEVGVTALDVALLHEQLLRGQPRLLPNDFDEEKMAALFGGHAAREAKRAFAVKQALVARAGLNKEKWEAVVHRIEPVRLPSQRIEAILAQAEAPGTLEALGWDRQIYATAKSHARFLRDRFTCLDLSLA